MSTYTNVSSIYAKVVLFFLLALNSSSLFSAGFYIQELGAPSSIGTAGTARTTNNYGPESAFGNPAGMTGIDETISTAGAQVLLPAIRFDSDIATAGGGDGGNAGQAAVIPSFYLVKPISENNRLGFSIVAPLGGGVDYGSDFVGRYATTQATLQGVSINTSIGHKVNEKLSLGAGVSLLYTLFEQDIAINQPGPLPDGKVEITDADDWSPQFFLGMQYQINDKTLLGVVYRSEADVDLSGDVDIKNTVLPFSPSGRVKVGWDNPQLLEVGIQHTVNDSFTLFFQAGWEDWSAFSNNQLAITGGPVSQVVELDRNFKDTWRAGVGMAFQMDDTALLLGTSYDSSPVRDSDRTFDLPFDEQFRISSAIIRKPNEGLNYGVSASFVYLGDGKVDQTSQGVRASGEFDQNWILFLGANLGFKF